MKRVTGIGGIFFKSKDPATLREWYRKHLSIPVEEWGGTAFVWDEPGGMTVWNIGDAENDYYAPSTAPFMVNYRVEDLHTLLAVLREEGCNVLDKVEESDFGKFGWVMDADGNKVELWEPPKHEN